MESIAEQPGLFVKLLSGEAGTEDKQNEAQRFHFVVTLFSCVDTRENLRDFLNMTKNVH